MEPVLQVKQGKLRGAIQKSILTGNEYYSFRGIPYAKPPINDLRFQAPVPLEKWDDILDATKDGMPCIQTDYMIAGVLSGSEDCLFLNVYTPNLPTGKTELKPVMVYIHGGGFNFNDCSSTRHGPDFLINYEVLLVTFNYRLHALGFLNMDTNSSVPNCGLRDQILALKWIKENIRQFGGDPDNITIFGDSAGAISVHYHIISPLSKSLVHKAILESGTLNCTWNLNSEPEKSAYLLAAKLGYKDGKNPKKVVDFLKVQTAEKITLAMNEMYQDFKQEYPGKTHVLSFLPSIETNKHNAVIPDHPRILMKSANPVPLIVGSNDKEGRLAFYTVGENLIKILQQDFTNCIKHEIKADKEQISAISKRIKEFYFGKKEVGPDTVDAVVDLYTDLFFQNFYESFENITTSKFPVYVYEFGFNGRLNEVTRMMMKKLGFDGSTGANHSDDLNYLFLKPVFSKCEFVEPELTVIKNMCTMWSNFARTGNPTQGMRTKWKPHTAENPCYLRIDEDLKLVEGIVRPKRIEFWKNLQIS